MKIRLGFIVVIFLSVSFSSYAKDGYKGEPNFYTTKWCLNFNMPYPAFFISYIFPTSSRKENTTAEIKTLLDTHQINEIDSLSKTELLKKEILKLNDELDELNEKIELLEKENQQLKLDLQKYDKEEKILVEKENQIEALKAEARNLKAILGDNNIPEAYISAQDLVIIGDIKLAESQFLSFIESNSHTKKSKNYLTSTSNSTFIAYSHYWLGKIENINGNYRKAVNYFSECYKITNYSNLSLMSLVGLMESLTALGKETEACTTINQFQQDYAKATRIKTFNFDPLYLNMVEKYKFINRCQISPN